MRRALLKDQVNFKVTRSSLSDTQRFVKRL